MVFMMAIISGKSGLARIRQETGSIKPTFQMIQLKKKDHLYVFQLKNRAGL